jgi:hypothetical protein
MSSLGDAHTRAAAPPVAFLSFPFTSFLLSPSSILSLPPLSRLPPCFPRCLYAPCSSTSTATYSGHMELSAFAHLTRRNVKVIQPGLVYVIEWAAGEGTSPTTSGQPSLFAQPSYSGKMLISPQPRSAFRTPPPPRTCRRSRRARARALRRGLRPLRPPLNLAASGSASALALAGASASASGSRRPNGVEVIDVDAGAGVGAGGAQVEEGTIYVA